MINSNIILKNAFIDAEIENIIPSSHKFSPQFESKMQSVIKYQKGFRKLINTTGKRVACIILSILLTLTTTVFSVEALREPVVDAIQSFFINVKEQLTGTRADNIAEYFIDDITEIKATNYFTIVPKEHIISEKEKINQFSLFS